MAVYVPFHYEDETPLEMRKLEIKPKDNAITLQVGDPERKIVIGEKTTLLVDWMKAIEAYRSKRVYKMGQYGLMVNDNYKRLIMMHHAVVRA